MVELHRKYLFSKTNKIILKILIIMVTIILLLSIGMNYPDDERWSNRINCLNNYLQNMIFTIKFVGIIFSCYIMGNAFNNYNDNYSVLFLRHRKERIKYFMGKVFSLFIFISSIIFIVLTIASFILYTYCNWFYDYIIILKISFRLTTIILTYGIISTVVTIIFKTSLAFVIPIILFICIDVLNDTIGDSNFYNNILLFLPNFDITNLIIPSLTNLVVILCYIVLGTILYYFRNE